MLVQYAFLRFLFVFVASPQIQKCSCSQICKKHATHAANPGTLGQIAVTKGMPNVDSSHGLRKHDQSQNSVAPRGTEELSNKEIAQEQAWSLTTRNKGRCSRKTVQKWSDNASDVPDARDWSCRIQPLTRRRQHCPTCVRSSILAQASMPLMSSLSFIESLLKFRIPSESFSVAIASSLNIQRNAASSR